MPTRGGTWNSLRRGPPRRVEQQVAAEQGVAGGLADSTILAADRCGPIHRHHFDGRPCEGVAAAARPVRAGREDAERQPGMDVVG